MMMTKEPLLPKCVSFNWSHLPSETIGSDTPQSSPAMVGSSSVLCILELLGFVLYQKSRTKRRELSCSSHLLQQRLCSPRVCLFPWETWNTKWTPSPTHPQCHAGSEETFLLRAGGHSLVSCSSPSWAPSSLVSFSSLLRLFFLCLWRRWLSPSSLSCCFLGWEERREGGHSRACIGQGHPRWLLL